MRGAHVHRQWQQAPGAPQRAQGGGAAVATRTAAVSPPRRVGKNYRAGKGFIPCAMSAADYALSLGLLQLLDAASECALERFLREKREGKKRRRGGRRGGDSTKGFKCEKNQPIRSSIGSPRRTGCARSGRRAPRNGKTCGFCVDGETHRGRPGAAARQPRAGHQPWSRPPDGGMDAAAAPSVREIQTPPSGRPIHWIARRTTAVLGFCGVGGVVV